jgi:hypothetical protein
MASGKSAVGLLEWWLTFLTFQAIEQEYYGDEV